MSLYDFVLLARSRWRWLLVFPALSIVATIMILALMPRAHGAHAVVRIDRSFLAAHAVALLSRYVTAVPRKGDGDVIVLTASAATSQEAVALLTAAMASVRTTAHLEARQRQKDLARLMHERRHLLARRDPFALIDYRSLSARIESLRSSTPAGDVQVIEIIEPVVTSRPRVLRPYQLAASGVSAMVVAFFAACVQAWWAAERARRPASFNWRFPSPRE